MERHAIRVFPRRTSYTPWDAMAFVGDPPLIRPEAEEVHVSVSFTWDIEEGYRLQQAWSQYYSKVLLGGPAMGSPSEDFVAGRYVKEGVTFTTRGCNLKCPWCLVPQREGMLQLRPIVPGWIVQDNNLLQAPRAHLDAVFEMLDRQLRAAIFAGGLQASLVDDWFANRLQGMRVESVFMAADTRPALKSLAKAVEKLAFLGRRKLRCYVLIGFNGESPSEASARLEAVWEIGAMPFAQLYQPPDGYVEYGSDWKALARKWSRPAAMMAMHKVEEL
ncbi:hypothetical protein CMI37_14355 [Candidatus Pacearchaeota archaeon]|nr:hypothetical protein [Candidatus Pacearchaeota archaeon]|tara:strand:- start:108 stop:932 length:825 start_codon:yes stop_codon:yes gene_type:complete